MRKTNVSMANYCVEALFDKLIQNNAEKRKRKFILKLIYNISILRLCFLFFVYPKQFQNYIRSGSTVCITSTDVYFSI